MPAYTTDDIRNIALVGQAGAGKTSLIEAVLHAAGAVASPGSVKKGTTVCDFDPQEKEYQHSLGACIVSLDHEGRHINLINTPGLPDFVGHALSAFEAVETVAVVISAESDIDMVARRMMERAAERKLCRAIIVNNIDVEGADLAGLLNDIRTTFGRECLPLNLPAQGGRAVVDCFFNPSGESDFWSVAEAHTEIIDQVVEVDEELMNLYLEQGEALSPEQLHEPFEKALREGHLVPVCFTSAETGAGIRELLEVFVRLMPSPREGNPLPFLKGEGADAAPFVAVPDPSLHALAHVFKVTADPFMGKLAVFRVHQGTVTKDSQLFIGDARKPFKVGHLFKLVGKERPEVEACIPGDICAVAKVEEIHFDAVLHDSHDEDRLHMQSVHFPAPMYGLALQVKNRTDEQKVNSVLAKLTEEDPCLAVEHTSVTNETVLRGMGELHLRIMLERLKSRYNVEVETRLPKIAYRETISANAEGHHRHKKQTGGAGQFGEVFLRVEPMARGEGFEFVDAVVGGVIPNQFIPAVEKGVRQVLESGAIAGYPMQDVRVTVYDGKYHPVDSKEVAFVTAGKKAFLDAILKAKAQVLEPIVNVEVVAPFESMGDITSSLSGKRARIQGSDTLSGGHMVSVKAQAPLSELGNYQGELRSITGGHGSFSMEFSHYEVVPATVQQELVKQYRPQEEE
jgi:elongation factor G